MPFLARLRASAGVPQTPLSVLSLPSVHQIAMLGRALACYVMVPVARTPHCTYYNYLVLMMLLLSMMTIMVSMDIVSMHQT